MKVLQSAAAKPLAIWRSQLEIFDGEVERHRRNVNPFYRPQLSDWVSKEAWMEISESKLLPQHRTDGTRGTKRGRTWSIGTR